MVGLVDLTPYKKKVPVAGTEIEVAGIPARRIAGLLNRFPELRKMFASRAINPEEIMKLAPDVITAIIAEGTAGKLLPGESEAMREERLMHEEEAADQLSLGDQLDLVSEIVLVTFPGGFGPLLKRLEQLGLGAVSSASAAQGSSLPTMAQDTRLPPAFRDSFNSGGTPQTSLGSTPPDKSPPGSNS
jgi:hypothetical protein